MKCFKASKIAVLFIFVTFAVFACNYKPSSEAVESAVREEITEMKVAKQANGAEIYKTSCARCHGESGEGTKKGISFLKGHALHHPEEDFIKQVSEGDGDEMPSFKDKLAEEEIKAVVKYVRQEIQKKPGEKQEQPHKH